MSREPLLLVPEELSISTSLAKERLHPLLQAAGLPDLEVHLSLMSTALPPAIAFYATQLSKVGLAEYTVP